MSKDSHHCGRFLQGPRTRREMLRQVAGGFGLAAFAALVVARALSASLNEMAEDLALEGDLCDAARRIPDGPQGSKCSACTAVETACGAGGIANETCMEFFASAACSTCGATDDLEAALEAECTVDDATSSASDCDSDTRWVARWDPRWDP